MERVKKMENFLQIRRTEIHAGLTREHRLFQISDMHLAYVDEQSDETELANQIPYHKQWDVEKREKAELFGEFCDERYDIDAHLIFERLCAHAVRFGAEALVISGDLMNRVGESGLRYLRRFFADYPLPVIYCPGNHEHIHISGERRDMFELFSDLIPHPAFDVFDFGDFDLVTLDNGIKQITEEQLFRMREQIAHGKCTLLVLHAPLAAGEFYEVMKGKMSPYFFFGAEKDAQPVHEMVRLICENDDRFLCVLAGHIHGATELHVTERLMQYTASSGLIGGGREIILD